MTSGEQFSERHPESPELTQEFEGLNEDIHRLVDHLRETDRFSYIERSFDFPLFLGNTPVIPDAVTEYIPEVTSVNVTIGEMDEDELSRTIPFLAIEFQTEHEVFRVSRHLKPGGAVSGEDSLLSKTNHRDNTEHDLIAMEVLSETIRSLDSDLAAQLPADDPFVLFQQRTETSPLNQSLKKRAAFTRVVMIYSCGVTDAEIAATYFNDSLTDVNLQYLDNDGISHTQLEHVFDKTRRPEFETTRGSEWPRGFGPPTRRELKPEIEDIQYVRSILQAQLAVAEGLPGGQTVPSEQEIKLPDDFLEALLKEEDPED